MILLDANMILRYLLNDNEEMADQAERAVNSGEAAVTIEVMAEVVYVLKGVYAMERDKIADTLKAIPHNSRHASCLHNVPSYCPKILANTGSIPRDFQTI